MSGRWFPPISLLVAGLGLSTGCGSGSSAVDASLSDAAVTTDDGANTFAGCAHDPRADVFAPGMTKAGNMGRLKVRLMAADPAGPPIRGINSWTIEVDDLQGVPQSQAVIKATPYMPDHLHGTSVTPVVTAQGTDGHYAVTELYLYMAGLWQVSLDVTTAAMVSDVAVFFFCVAQ